jgi:aminoglycoside phosphotransferase (APT) family kinase protein
VVKLGPPGLIAHEAAALERVAGLGVAPPVVAVGEGVLVTPRMPGAVRRLADLDPDRLRELGAMVRRVHDLEHSDAGALPGWDEPVDTLAAYRARRAGEMVAAAGPRTGLAHRVAQATADRDAPGARPFRRLHSDVWGGNIVWDGDRPTLVDWEYSHLGDPAHELAYAAALDDLDDARVAALLAGYGGDAALAARVADWRPLAALEAAVWYEDVGDPERAAALAAQAERLLG